MKMVYMVRKDARPVLIFTGPWKSRKKPKYPFYTFRGFLIPMELRIGGSGGNAQSGGGAGGGPFTNVGILLLFASAFWFLIRWNAGDIMDIGAGESCPWFNVPLDAVDVMENGWPLFGVWSGEDSEGNSEDLGVM